MGNEVLTLAIPQSQGLVVPRVAQEVATSMIPTAQTLTAGASDVTAIRQSDGTIAFTGGITATDNHDGTLSFPVGYAHDNGDGTISFGTLLFDPVIMLQIANNALVLK